MGALTTPSPYLRDRLLQAADGLRDDAETARNRLDAADIDVAEARELLAEAEAAQRRAQAEVDGIARDLAWVGGEVARLTAEIDAAPAERLAETGLVPKDIDPSQAEPQRICGNCNGVIYHNRLLGQWEHARDGEAGCDVDDPDTRLADPCPDDDLTAPGVIDSRAEIARVTGGIPVVPPPVPDGPPMPTPDALTSGAALTTLTDPPAPETDGPRHASTDTGRLRAIAARVGLIHHEHDDAQGDDRG